MINSKLNKEIIKNHFNYSKLIYIAAIAGAIIFVSLIYTMTEPDIPAENKVDICMYCGLGNESLVEEWENNMLSIMPSNQRQVNLLTNLEMNDSMLEAVIARTAAGEGDILIMHQDYISSFMRNMAFVALEDLIDIEAFEKANPDIDWSNYSYTDDDGQEHIYLLPIDSVTGFYEMGINPTDSCMGIYYYSKNIENSVKCMNYILEQNQYVVETLETSEE